MGGVFVRSLVALALVSGFPLAACGEEDEKFPDRKIVDALGLEEAESGYAIGGDPFCVVEKQLLNDADEVDSARDADEIGLVIASTEANVGIQAAPPFAPDCKRDAKRSLNKLDPKPED